MPDIFQLAVRPDNLVVPMAASAAGSAGPSQFSSGIAVNVGGPGFTNPPTVTFVQVPSLSQIIVSGSVYGGPGGHASSDWEVTTAADTSFASPVLSSYDDASNLLSITFDSTSLTEGDSYLARTRQTDSSIGDSDWSVGYAFTNSVLTANEPSNFVSITERNFSAINENDWWVYDPNSHLSIISDITAPTGGSDLVAASKFPAGSGADWFGPALTGYLFNPKVSNVYISFYHKLSSSWQFHPSGNNKTIRMRDNSSVADGGSIPFELDASENGQTYGGSYAYRGFTGHFPYAPQRYFTHNIATVRVSAGDWVLIELIFRHQTTSNVADGEFHMWVNGTKTDEHFDVNWMGTSGSDLTWSETKWDPIWGGSGGTIDADQYQYIDYWYVSGI